MRVTGRPLAPHLRPGVAAAQHRCTSHPAAGEGRLIAVRNGAARDRAAVLSLNNAATPHVNELTERSLGWIVDHADYFRVAEDEAGLTGFVLALRSGLEYWSLNYRWFGDRGGDFLYLDRIVVAERARRLGVGRALYDDIGRFASGKWPLIALEVNLRPPNPGSLAFHERLGFRRVGVREEDGGTKAVAMMELRTPARSLPGSGDGRSS
jgi:predicted GNAT superfamily acetyltransferase